MPFISRVIRLIVGTVESFYDNHTLEQPFHGNRMATLYCPLLYMYMYDDYYGYDVHVLWMNIIAQVMDGFVVPPNGQN